MLKREINQNFKLTKHMIQKITKVYQPGNLQKKATDHILADEWLKIINLENHVMSCQMNLGQPNAFLTSNIR